MLVTLSQCGRGGGGATIQLMENQLTALPRSNSVVGRCGDGGEGGDGGGQVRVFVKEAVVRVWIQPLAAGRQAGRRPSIVYLPTAAE